MTEDIKDFEDELVGSLDGEPAIERVIDQESARVYQVRACLAILDSPFYDFSAAEFTSPNPLPVFSSSGERIGFAALALDGQRLLADITIDYATPERLDIETGKALYAAPCGDIDAILDEPEPPFIDLLGGRMKVEGVYVTYLVLVEEPPRDERLRAPLGTPIVWYDAA